LLREQLRKARKVWKKQASLDSFLGMLIPGRLFLSKRGTPYIAVSHPQIDDQMVEAVRLAGPLKFRRGRLRTHRVAFHRIKDLCDKLDGLPPMDSRTDWVELAEQIMHKAAENQLCSPSHSSPDRQAPSPSVDAKARELAGIITQKATLPCDGCALYGPCHKTASHPFASAIQSYFEHYAQMHSIQEQLWKSFLQHYNFLKDEGYVTNEGQLTEDGLWASKLRLDQPLLISEGIRRGVFPSDNPELLGALIAPFVMDRERPGDVQLASMVWKYPDLAKPFFKMLEILHPLREHLNSAGFTTPPLSFWTLVTLYHWAKGASWEQVREVSGMDEGDLAMVILRTADHLRQIESLLDTHPALAVSARRAIDLILREPVLV
jgi:hypothetical protein